MSRSASRYSEGELSDSASPADMADDISLSPSEDEHNRDVLDIKPPQPQAGSRSKSKTSSRDRGYDRRSNTDQRSLDKRSHEGASHHKKEHRSDRREARESREFRDSRKEDLRERLERERRLRMGNKEREEQPESKDSDDRRRYSSHRRDKPTESRSRKDYTVEEQQERDRHRDERHRRRKTEVQVVISSPESDNQAAPEEEQMEKVEAAKQSSSPSSESSDEGEASSSSSSSTSGSTGSDEKASSPETELSKPNGQHRSPNSAVQDKDISVEDDEPEVKRRKNESPSRMDTETPLADEATEVVEEKEELLPPYLPAIMGCRSVGEFQCLNKIEEGTYGVVYRAQDKRTNEIVALKRLKMEREKEGFPITSLREVSTLLKAQHENIVTVREIVVGSNMDSIFMVMDYVEHDLKSLMEVLKARKQFFLPGEVKCLLIQLLRAVAHLHDNWILHRDLKTSNILLSHSGILKVGDFGLAREYGSPLKAYTSVVVTLWYRAPELLLGVKEYSTPIDVWSVGCIFGELLTLEAIFQGKFEADQVNRIFRELGTPNDNIWPGYSELPFVKKATFTNNPISHLRKRFSSRLSELGIDLLQKFLTYDPQRRVTAEEALKHTYLKEQPYPIHPSMLPTWPAKSESNGPRKAQSPKPPSGGRAFKQLGDNDNDVVDVDSNTGFHMGGTHVDRHLGAGGVGFSLKF